MEPDKAVIMLEDSSGRLFVNQRSADKRLFPLKYTLGAGGHIEPGETPEEAASRELKEELGLEGPLRKLFTIDFSSPKLTHRLHVFFLKHDGELKGCDEFKWCGWMSLQEVDKLVAEGKLCPDTAMFYRKWKRSLR